MTFNELYLTNPEFHAWYYNLINNASTEKILLLQGPSRSGKSTICRAMIQDLEQQGLTSTFTAWTDSLEVLLATKDLVILDNLSQRMISSLSTIALFTVSLPLHAGIVITYTAGTKPLALQEDMRARILVIDLPAIPASQMKSEQEVLAHE